MTKCCILACLVLLTVCFAGASFRTPDPFISQLLERVSKKQVVKDQSYRTFISWHKTKGVYSSQVVFNFHGTFLMAEARRLVRIFDNNMFAMSLVTSSLLEAFKYGRAPRPSDNQLILSINALKSFQDKNVPYNTSVMTFWQQHLNESTHYWESRPINLIGAFHLLDILPMRLIEVVLKVVGLGELAKYIESVREEKSMFLRAFHIPPDFDDTFVNLALGSLLLEQKDEFPSAWKLWKSHNTNITSAFDALRKYAYRPFSADADLNSIDPRTYFHIRGFLDQAMAKGQDVVLVPTWIQSIIEDRQEYHLGVGMPFQVNNVDVTVAANTIFSITSAVISGLVAPTVLEDKIISQIYQNTTSLIAYEIMNNFSGRPDLALTYYPSRMEFYWFVGRTLALLESARRRGVLPVKVMDTIYEILLGVTESHMTRFILGMAKREGMDKVYFDDFLGDGDVTRRGKPWKLTTPLEDKLRVTQTSLEACLIRGEDRIFTTAMAANALLSVWTYYDVIPGKSRWKKGTPKIVRETVKSCVKWLRQHTLHDKYDPWNAFFSGSGKSFESLPFWYPANRLEYLNGTAISDWSSIPNSTFIYAVQGYVPADEYNTMLKKKHFGYNTPTTFGGYNNGSGFFPLWSSVPYTYSTTLLAVSRFDNTLV